MKLSNESLIDLQSLTTSCISLKLSSFVEEYGTCLHVIDVESFPSKSKAYMLVVVVVDVSLLRMSPIIMKNSWMSCGSRMLLLLCCSKEWMKSSGDTRLSALLWVSIAMNKRLSEWSNVDVVDDDDDVVCLISFANKGII